MRHHLLRALVGLALAGQASAVSTVQYSVELGGDNHVSAYESGSPQYFTRGTGGAHTYAIGQPITWNAVVQVSGTDSAGRPIYGATNLVFSLNLHQGSMGGPLAGNVQWLSTINDGDGGDIL